MITAGQLKDLRELQRIKNTCICKEALKSSVTVSKVYFRDQPNVE